MNVNSERHEFVEKEEHKKNTLTAAIAANCKRNKMRFYREPEPIRDDFKLRIFSSCLIEILNKFRRFYQTSLTMRALISIGFTYLSASDKGGYGAAS